MRNLKKSKENNNAYVLIEVIIYITVSCLIMATSHAIYNKSGDECIKIYNRLESIENGVLDVIIYKNSLLKGKDMVMNTSVNNYMLTYYLQDDYLKSSDKSQNSLPFKKIGNFYVFDSKVNEFATGRNLKVIIDRESDIVTLESMQDHKKVIRRTFNLSNSIWDEVYE